MVNVNLEDKKNRVEDDSIVHKLSKYLIFSVLELQLIGELLLLYMLIDKTESQIEVLPLSLI